jgi:hypothetical protein
MRRDQGERPAQLVAVAAGLGLASDGEAGRLVDPLAAPQRPALHVAHEVRDHQQVTRMVQQQFIALERQGAGRRVPGDLVDANPGAGAKLGRAADVQQVDAVACHRRRIDVAGEGDREARRHGKAVECVEHIDVLAIARSNRTVRLWQGHAAPGQLRGVQDGMAVAGKGGSVRVNGR